MGPLESQIDGVHMDEMDEETISSVGESKTNLESTTWPVSQVLAMKFSIFKLAAILVTYDWAGAVTSLCKP